jgi:uncharacterized protein involved in exopolysaccharide biosynthesis
MDGQGGGIQPAARTEGHLDGELSLRDIVVPLVQHWKVLVVAPLLAGAMALGIAFLLPPTFTARTSLLPPQQQQSMAASALASLGALAGLAGGAAGIKSPADQYVALMQSVSVTDRLVDRFKLMDVYDAQFRFEARRELAENTRIVAGKKDGLISVEVDDRDPKRAAEIANAYVDELKRMTSVLAVSEAQQRRTFFEKELKDARDQLTKAQQELQASGFNINALRAEPKAAAESYAQLRAEVTAAEVRTGVLRGQMAETSPEMQRQMAELRALRDQLARLEQSAERSTGPDYVSKYREYKYRETLFELFARQYEVARVDESREGALIQVVDVAQQPEYKSKPKRLLIALIAGAITFLLVAFLVVTRHFLRVSTFNR